MRGRTYLFLCSLKEGQDKNIADSKRRSRTLLPFNMAPQNLLSKGLTFPSWTAARVSWRKKSAPKTFKGHCASPQLLHFLPPQPHTQPLPLTPLFPSCASPLADYRTGPRTSVPRCIPTPKRPDEQDKRPAYRLNIDIGNTDGLLTSLPHCPLPPAQSPWQLLFAYQTEDGPVVQILKRNPIPFKVSLSNSEPPSQL